MTYKLLIVDDEPANIRLLERLFRNEYYCLTAASGEEALKLLEQHEVAVIITDQRMPEMTGIELLKRSTAHRPHMVRILLTGYTDLEALVEAVNCGLVYMYVSKPWSNDDLKLRISRAVQHYEDNKRQHSLVAANERFALRIKEMKLGFVKAIAGILKLKDEYSYAHCSRVSKYATMIGESFGLNEALLEDLTAAALLHDLGRIGTSNEVLTKGDLFSSFELSIMELSPDRAAQVLSCFPELRDVADIIRYHKENYDGSGYPIGLIGEQIPITSRIIRVASEFDSMTVPREQTQAISHREAIDELRKRAGRELDGRLIQILSGLVASEPGDRQELDADTIRPGLIYAD